MILKQWLDEILNVRNVVPRGISHSSGTDFVKDFVAMGLQLFSRGDTTCATATRWARSSARISSGPDG
jgi:hypothetical protein